MRKRRLIWPSERRLRGPGQAIAAARLGTGEVQGAETEVPRPQLPLSGRDEAIFLLHIAAEIEHSLMVQYLYAAYSLNPDSATGQSQTVLEWQHAILDVAREEMGHLVTVQNVLRCIGGPLTFSREDYPFQSELYPYPFQLEPLSRFSLAKYIVAEMPAEPGVPEIEQIKEEATRGNAGMAVNRVGKLYERLIDLFHDADKLPESEFDAASVGYQADFATWSRNYSRGRSTDDHDARKGQRAPELIVRPVSTRTTAIAALQAVAEQGEGASMHPDVDTSGEISHFERFLEIYRAFVAGGQPLPVKPVPVNPVTMEFAPGEATGEQITVITRMTSRWWAQLFNVRYRMLLDLLMHALHVEGSVQTVGGSPSARGRLIVAAFGEMYHLRALAEIVTRQPLSDAAGSTEVCGPPFELPYSLALPEREVNRWRLHRDVLRCAQALIVELSRAGAASERNFLRSLAAEDQKFLTFIETILTSLGQTLLTGA